jgi:hypothetical protein
MRLAWLALAPLLALPSAWAKRPRVAVLDITNEGDAPAEIRTKMEISLAGGLYSAGYDVVGRAEVQKKLRGARELVGCTTSTCLAKIRPLVGAEKFVRARVESQGSSFSVSLELYSPDASGGLVRRQERSCAVCTMNEANDLMSALATSIFEDRKPEKVTLTVESVPSGAQVQVDGAPLGAAPVQTEVEPGDHTVRAELSGRASAEEKVTIEAGSQGRRLSLALPMLRSDPPADRASPSRFGAWKWVTVGGGVAALAGGVALIAINGTLTDCPGDGTNCPSKYQTIAPGVVLVGAGLALGGLAVYMFMNDAQAPAAALVPLPGGAAAVVRGRF